MITNQQHFAVKDAIKYCSIPSAPSGLEEVKTRPESSRWMLHRSRDTKKLNIPGCREKKKKRKEKRKTKSRKQGTKSSKKIVLKASP